MDTSELIVAMLVAAVALGLLVGVVASRVAVGYFHRQELRHIALATQDIATRNRLLDERAAVQRNIDHDLRVREEAVSTLGQRAKEASNTLRTEAESFDTMVSVMDWDALPDPRENDDTVAMPRVED